VGTGICAACWHGRRGRPCAPKAAGPCGRGICTKTAVKGLSKKKTVVAAGRRMAELMYSVLRNKSVYEPRPWTGARDDTAELTKLAVGE